MDRRLSDRTSPRKAGSPAPREARRTGGLAHHHQEIDFRRKNWILFGGGILSIVLGFLLLSSGDITLAPLLLLLGYLVLIPWALVARPRVKDDEVQDSVKAGR